MSDVTRDALALVTAVGKDDTAAVHALLSGIEVRYLLSITIDLAHVLWAIANAVTETFAANPSEQWERACALLAAGLDNDA